MSSTNYDPHPNIGADLKLDKEITKIIEQLARNSHEKWAQERMAEGYVYGTSEDNAAKTNPYLKSYDDLTDKEKEPDRKVANGVIRFLLGKGYTITKKSLSDKMKWHDATELCYARYYDEVKIPEYRVPLIIGLSGQDTDKLDAKNLRNSLDKFVDFINRNFEKDGILTPSAKTENDKRLTPIYVLSALESQSERTAADYLEKEYFIPTIKLLSEEDGSKGRHIVVEGDKTAYMISNCFMLLSLWDGAAKGCPAGKAVIDSLLESELKESTQSDLQIGDTCPVYQIVLPSAELEAAVPDKAKSFAYKSRLLLPHTLESGLSWYLITNAKRNDIRARVSKKVKGLLLELIDRSEYDQYNKGQKRTIRDKVKEELEVAHNSVTDAGGPLKKQKAYKKLKKKVARQINYNFAVGISKKKAFSDNVSMLTSVNRSLRKAEKHRLFSKYSAADNENAYDLLRGMDDNGTEINMHGCSLSADTTNLRQLRYDTIATERQNRHKKLSVLTAVFVAAGLFGYGIFSDLSAPNSYLGVVGGILSAVSILIALIAYFLNSKRKLHSAHINLRLLSECLRTKTFWNLVGLGDKNVDDYFTERQHLDLDWAKSVLRAWNVIDRVDGFYNDPDADVPYPMVCKLWLGTEDEAKDPSSTDYTPSNDGQISFYRKRSNEFVPMSEKNERLRSLMSSIAVVLTMVITIVIAFDFVVSHPLSNLLSLFSGKDFSFTNLTENLLKSESLETLESFFIFVIGLLPAWTACYLLYKETRKFAENAKRYKWMAVKYQKLISCFNKEGLSAEQQRAIFEEAGKTAIEECADYNALISDSDINLPF